jgi:hypothetical protein
MTFPIYLQLGDLCFHPRPLRKSLGYLAFLWVIDSIKPGFHLDFGQGGYSDSPYLLFIVLSTSFSTIDLIAFNLLMS